MIPRVIHYCWFGKKNMPAQLKKYRDSWRRYCPDYEIREWNEDNFDVNCHPFVLDAYSAGKWAFVSDYARLKIIYDCGGIYFDTDVELIRKIDELLELDCFLGVGQGSLMIATGLGFGAVAGHPMVKAMLEEYDAVKFQTFDVLRISCPRINNRALEKLGYQRKDGIQCFEGATIFPPCYLDPYASGKGVENLMCEKTYSIHHYSATWTGRSQRFKRKIAAAIGEDKIIALKRALEQSGRKRDMSKEER